MEVTEKEKKKHLVLGDFNVDLMKTDTLKFDILTSNLFVSHIVHPTRLTPTTHR